MWDGATGGTLLVLGDASGTPPNPLYWATWSPDSRSIAISNLSSIQIWDVTTASSIFTLSTPGEVLSLAWSPDSNYIASTQEQVVIVWKAE